jgi:hypothetical protein
MALEEPRRRRVLRFLPLFLLSAILVGGAIWVMIYDRMNGELFLSCHVMAGDHAVSSGCIAEAGYKQVPRTFKIIGSLLAGVVVGVTVLLYAKKFTLRSLIVAVLLVGVIGAIPATFPEQETTIGMICIDDDNLAYQGGKLIKNSIPGDVLDKIVSQAQPKAAFAKMPPELAATIPDDAVLAVTSKPWITGVQGSPTPKTYPSGVRVEFKRGLSRQVRDTVFHYYCYYITAALGEYYDSRRPAGEPFTVYAVDGANNTASTWQKWSKDWESSHFPGQPPVQIFPVGTPTAPPRLRVSAPK